MIDVSPGGSREARERLRRELERVDAAGLLVLSGSSRDHDLAPFVGSAHLGRSFLIWPRRGSPALGFFTDMEREEAAATGLDLLTPSDLGLEALRELETRPGELWTQVVQRGLELRGEGPRHWLLAGHLDSGVAAELAVATTAAGWRWRAGGEALRCWRKHKGPNEIAAVTEAAAGVCAAMRSVATILASSRAHEGALWFEQEPLTVARLRREVRRVLSELGMTEPEGNIMAQGRDGGVPHNQGADDHVLVPGSPLVVDLFPAGRLFADCTRTFCVGEPSEAFERAHAQVRKALEASHRACRAGVAAYTLQEAVCSQFEAEGLPTPRSDPGSTRGYVHGLGHGVGYELHEYPSFREEAGPEGRLEVGDVFTLEPGLYEPDAGYGVRLEDLCTLTEDGVSNLTPLPYDWNPAGWTRSQAP